MFIYKIDKIIGKLYKRIFPEQVRGIVFMLHRVSDKVEEKLFANENMKIPPLVFQKQIQQIKSKYNIISIWDINKYHNKSKPFAVITFDDGYKDNYLNAHPILCNEKVPYTIFATKDFLDQKAVLWWYVLEDLLLQNDSITLSDGSSYLCKDKKDKESVFLEIRDKILCLNQTKLLEELQSLFSNYSIDWYGKNKELCLNWDDYSYMVDSPYVTFGDHTKHHFNLKKLETTGLVVQEIFDGQVSSRKKRVLAYPFGTDNEVSLREEKIAKKLKYKYAFVSYGGEISNYSLLNKYALPRVMLTEDTII